MIEYDKKRIDELCSLNSLISTEDARYIVSLENMMTKHKDMIIELNDYGIIKESELDDKLSACFDCFLSKVSEHVGPATCKSIYDYESGEKLDFLNKIEEGQLVANARKLASASSELTALIHRTPEYTPLCSVAVQISESSKTLSRHVYEEHKTLLLLDNDLSRGIDIFKALPPPIAVLNFDKKTILDSGAGAGAGIYEIRDSASAIALLLESASHSIRKLVRE